MTAISESGCGALDFVLLLINSHTGQGHGVISGSFVAATPTMAIEVITHESAEMLARRALVKRMLLRKH